MVFYNPIRILMNSKNYVMGLTYLRTSKYSEAIDLLQKGLIYAKKNGLPIYEFTKYLGMAYCCDKQFQKGKEYLLEVERLRVLKAKHWMDSELFFYLGLVYDFEADLIKAKEYYQMALKFYKRDDYYTNIDFINDRLIKIDKR